MSPHRQVGPYRLLERLGRGGMGEVWRADDVTGAAGGAPRQVALKLLDPALTRDPGARARFAREVAAARRVRGPSVAALLDADVDASQPWLAAAYVAGPTLADHVARHGPLPGAPLRALGAALADALVSIHAAGVVHRDLTPRNVVLGPDGPRVVDFGIARFEGADAITRPGAWVGTPAWVAPERLGSDAVTAASDVWSWGAVMAFAARGRPAVGGDNLEIVGRRAAAGILDLAGVPPWLAPWVRATMAPRPGDRPRPDRLRAAMSPDRAWPAPGPAIAGAGLPTVDDAAPPTAVRPRPPSGGTGRGAAGGGRRGGGPPAGSGHGPRGSGPARGAARWISAALVLGAAGAIGLLGGLLAAVVAAALLTVTAVVLRVAREGRAPGARPVPPTWSVGLAGLVALGAGLVGALGPVWGLGVLLGLVVVFVVLGGDIV